MDDFTERRPARPIVTAGAVLLAVQLGADCPHKLARVFDVSILHPDLIHACNDLTALRVIRGMGDKHTEPGGFTCTPIVVVPSCMRDDL